jgi:hypothetical protein
VVISSDPGPGLRVLQPGACQQNSSICMCFVGQISLASFKSVLVPPSKVVLHWTRPCTAAILGPPTPGGHKEKKTCYFKSEDKMSKS